MSWWTDASREAFTQQAEARGMSELDTRGRKKSAIHIQNGAQAGKKPQRVSLTPERRGKHQRFASEDRTVCASCPRALTPTEQIKGMRRCRVCRRVNPGVPRRREAAA